MRVIGTRHRAIAAGAIALLALAPFASSTVREKFAGAWRGFMDPSGAAQQSEPAPVDAPPAEDDLADISERADLEGDFSLVDPEAPDTMGLGGVVTSLSDLNIPFTHRTSRYIEYFADDQDGREAFVVRYRRSARYREHIEEALRYAHMPEDLTWVAAIESGFVPQASSAKGAVGLFQFMPETAERFGLTIGPDIDERRSIPRSTEAAIAYLQILSERFGAWDLALAAYNCGEGCIEEAIEKGRDKLGRGPEEPVAFHELANLKLLPKETADFVPKVHAFAIVVHNRELLALDDLDPLPPMRFAQIAVPAGTMLSTIARAAGISVGVLRDYNPELLGERLPAGKADVLVNISSDVLAQTLAALPAHLSRDEPAPPAAEEPPLAPRLAGAEKSGATSPGGKTATNAGSNATGKGKALTGGKGEPALAQPEKPTLRPAPLRAGAVVVSSGVVIDVKKEEGTEVSISARIDVLDPTKGRQPLGSSASLTDKRSKVTDLKAALEATKKDLRTLALGTSSGKLRERLSAKRRGLYEQVHASEPFLALSEHVFPKGHPMQGTLLVGPTEPADDMFLELEPTWALDTVVTLRGPLEVDQMAAELESAFADTFVPTRAAGLPKAGTFRLGTDERRVLVGWASTPPRVEDETAMHLAFVLACHNRLGRIHRGLRLDRNVTGRLNCGLELSPHTSVAWVFAMPSMPNTVADVEKHLDAALLSLTTDGPTDNELTAAKGLLRAELARERETATLRSLPKSWVTAHNDQLLSKLKGLQKKDVIEAARLLFSKDRRLVIISG